MLNKVILIGRLTKDPEVKMTTQGFSVANFTLAVNRSYSSSNGEKQADFINCVSFRKLAEIVGRYTSKGQLVSVEGRIQTRTYDTPDGQRRWVTEIVCDNVVFLESQRSQNNNNSYQQSSQQQPSFNQQQPSFNNNQQRNGNQSQSSDDYFQDNPKVDISEDDLPF